MDPENNLPALAGFVDRHGGAGAGRAEREAG
jgi:hypothetical protein